MISDAQLRRVARELDVRLGYAEKNYVNSWILWAIHTSSYGDNLLFKGGTALGKLYFPETWRYSEDLDFGVEGEYHGTKSELRDVLEDAARASGIDFEVTKHRELQKEAYPTHYVDIDIQYNAVLGHKNTTSLDVMIDEYVAFASVSHRHSYEDVPEFEVTAYSLEEIFAEKLRALYHRGLFRCDHPARTRPAGLRSGYLRDDLHHDRDGRARILRLPRVGPSGTAVSREGVVSPGGSGVVAPCRIPPPRPAFFTTWR